VGSYLLMPAEQYAHGLTATLAAATSMDLREAGRLGGDVTLAACWCSLCHAFVTAIIFVSL
jgi:hypothetical protein